MHLVTFERIAQEGARRAERLDQRETLRRGGHGLDAIETGRPGSRRFGAVLPAGPNAGDIVDLNRALALKLAFEDVGAPEVEADSLVPPDALRFLLRFERALPAAREALAFVLDALERYDAPDLARAGVVEPRARVRLCAPVPRPGKILAVARNYAAHAAEAGGKPPGEPVLFLKPGSAVVGPGDDIVIPRTCQQVDFEGELAVVIGRRAHCVSSERALGYVAGYTVANDVSARDFQNVRGQSFIGKACDSFAPLGPVLVSADAIPDPQDLGLRTVLSGELMQAARTKEMVFPVSDLIAFASGLMTLEPGDVLLTGTPAGVGAHRKPPRWLVPGDVVEIEIERIGRLHNHVRQERDEE